MFFFEPRVLIFACIQFLNELIIQILHFIRVHYKEYLVNKINKAKLDPVELYNTQQVKLILKREEVEQIPDQEDDEEDDDYKARLIEVKIPIVLFTLSST